MTLPLSAQDIAKIARIKKEEREQIKKEEKKQIHLARYNSCKTQIEQAAKRGQFVVYCPKLSEQYQTLLKESGFRVSSETRPLESHFWITESKVQW